MLPAGECRDKRAKGDIIAFIDADCIPDKDWLKEIRKHLKRMTLTDWALTSDPLSRIINTRNFGDVYPFRF